MEMLSVLFSTSTPMLLLSNNALLLLLSFLFLTLVLLHQSSSNKKNKKIWPPSPPTLPFIGNLHQLSKDGNLLSSLTNLAKSHGPVMTVWTGTIPLVVLTGQTAIWEALVNQATNFAGRPPLYSRTFVSGGYKTMISSAYNDHWMKLRKVLNTNVLGPFHVASQGSSHHTHVSDLINKLVKEMKENSGVVRPFHAFKIMAINFIAPLCFGPDFHDERFANKVAELIAEDIRLSRGGDMLLNLYPFTRYFIPASATAEKGIKALRDGILDLLLPLIQSARSYRGYFKKTAPNCFLNCLLSIGEEEQEEEEKLSDDVIAFNLFELFMLAVDSTSTTIEWALAYLINHPQIQERAYQEINEAVGEGRGKGQLIRLEDVGKLPYVGGVVKETLRKESIAPLAMMHQAENECKVMGVSIPAKARVIFNLHSVAHDPEVWKEADTFMPERFLGQVDSNKVRMSYLPFGAGRRICAGMDVANVHVPITLANLLMKFEWMCVKEGTPPDLTRDIPSVLLCMKYPLEARIRCR